MWFIKAFFGIVILAALLFFASLNTAQKVDIYLSRPDVPTFHQVPMTWALLVAFAGGVLVWFVVSLFQVLSAKSEPSSHRRKNRRLTRELTDLRNMTVQDLDPDDLDGAEDADSDGN